MLTIAIPSTWNRIVETSKLIEEFERQTNGLKEVEIISEFDNKEMTIGEKRELLLHKASGKYIVQWDSDDWVHPNGVSLILTALQHSPDCVGYKEKLVMDGVGGKKSNISKKYSHWQSNFDGFDYVRTIFNKSVVRRDLAILAGFPNVRWNEDEQFSIRLKPLLRREAYIDEFIYWYNYSSKENHNEKFGIK